MGETDTSTKPVVSEFCNDADMMELVEMFVDELPDKAAAMEKAFNDQDLDELRRLSHQLKGAAGGYGFPTITDAAKVVEADVRAEEALEKLAQEVKELVSLCGRARATSS